MPARLFSKTRETRGLEVQIDDEVTIGRHQRNLLVIDQPQMSNRHARVFYDVERSGYVIEDLDSLNGTLLDGEPIRGREPLDHLHVITFAGCHDFFFQDETRCAMRAANVVAAAEDRPRPSDQQEEENSITTIHGKALVIPSAIRDAVEPRPTSGEKTALGDLKPIRLPGALSKKSKEPAEQSSGPGPLSEPPRPPSADPPAPPPAPALESRGERPLAHLRVQLTSGEWISCPVGPGGQIIGRGKDAHIEVPDPHVSSRHASVRREADRWLLQDLGSVNGTFVDDRRLEPETEIEITPTTNIRFGNLVAQLQETDR